MGTQFAFLFFVFKGVILFFVIGALLGFLLQWAHRCD
jgi:hypothetical protein